MVNDQKIWISVLVILSAVGLAGCLTPEEPYGTSDLGAISNDSVPPQISGSPQRVAIMNKRYEFHPSTSGGNTASLSFAIQNKPRWAEFDSSSGRLSGSPTFADSGTYENIVITVTDGTSNDSLPAFSISVSQDGLGAVTLSWLAPEANTDGSYISDLAGYSIYYGMDSEQYNREVHIDNVGITTYVIDDLSPGTYFFVATAINSAGFESDYSNEIFRSVIIN